MLLTLQIFFVICCLLMILVVLMQRSEGAGVAGMLGGGQGEAIFGTKTINVLARFTAGLGAVLLVLIIILGKMGSSNKSLMDDVQSPAPVTPAATKTTETIPAKAPATKVAVKASASAKKAKAPAVKDPEPEL